MIARVNNKGKVKANRLGTATIYAQVEKMTYRCKITVQSGIDINGITMNYNNTIFTKEILTLKLWEYQCFYIFILFSCFLFLYSRGWQAQICLNTRLNVREFSYPHI